MASGAGGQRVVTAPADPVGGDAAQRAARAELRHSEYHRDDPGPIERATHWLTRRLDSLFSGGAGDYALLVLLVVVLAVVIVFAVRAGVPVRGAGNTDAEALDPLAPVAARDHRRRAEQLTAEGPRAEALREWLRAAVQTIEERGVLPPRPGRTGSTTAREAAPILPTAAPDLATAMAAFDEVWFGGREATDTDVAGARAAADGVVSARIARAARAPDGLAIPW